MTSTNTTNTTNTTAVAAGVGRATRPDASMEAPAIAKFPDFPPRSDMMNTRHLHDQGHQPALRRHFGNPDSTIVLGEVPIARNVPRGRAGVRIPDLLIAFDVRRAHILAQQGYAIGEQGKPPDFVLEVASDTTAGNDENAKWRDYANFGVTEYWLFDPDWGQRYSVGLAGWTLVNGRYEPIAIHQYAPNMYYGVSAVLGLQVCWEHGALRWYDPIAQRYLDTFDSIADARDAAVAQQDAVAAQRDEAAAQRDAERDGRIAAEAEAQRLRDEIARLREREA